MRLGIMQPYFMPYLGYFALIKHTDEFILFDTVQFIYHGWIERNRMLKQTGGWQYIAVPLQKHSRETKIQDILINNEQPWQKKMVAQLQHYRRAPYYRAVMGILEELFASDYENITQLDRKALQLVCEYLGIHREFPVFSEMNCPIATATAPDEWALNICKALGADEYWNPPGGMEFFDREKYRHAGVDLRFQKIVLEEYPQRGEPFEARLSILDVMMFNSPERINEMLDKFELE